MNKTNLQLDLELLKASAYPYVGNGTHFVNKGINTLLYVACTCKDDFDSLPEYMQDKIAPERNFNDDLKRLAVGRARWRIMQAKALINESNL